MLEREQQTQKSVLQRLKDVPRRRLSIDKIAEIVTNTSWQFSDGNFYNLISGRKFEYVKEGDRLHNYKYVKHKGINLGQEERSEIAKAIMNKFESLKGDSHTAESRKKLLIRLLSFDQVEGMDNLKDYLINTVNNHHVGAEVLTLKFGPKSLLKLKPEVLQANLSRHDFSHDSEGLVDYDTPLNRTVYSLKIDLLKAVGILKSDKEDSSLIANQSIVPLIPNIIDTLIDMQFRIGSEKMRQHAQRIKNYFASFNSVSAFGFLVAAVDSNLLFRDSSDRKLIRSKLLAANITGSQSVDREYPDGWHVAQDYQEYYCDRVRNTYEYFENPKDNPIARGAIESLGRIAGKHPALKVQYERVLKHFRKKYEHSPRRRTLTIDESTNIRPIPGIKTRYRYVDF